MHRPRGFQFWACAVLASLSLGMTTRADDAGDADKQTAEVRAAAREYAAAMRRRDTEALLRSWTEKGDYVDATGRSHQPREQIRKMAEKPQAETAAADAASVDSSVRFITPNVAIEDGAYDCGSADDGSAVTGHFTAVWVKRDGRWLLDSLRESVSASPPRDEHLNSLEWLLGEWVGKADDSVMLMSARVSDRGNYIIRDFAVLGEGGEATATERIAWDPSSGGYKSWTFDSQDGRSEGQWKRDGDQWIIATKEVMGDGESATTSSIVAPQGDNQFIWEVKSSKVGDQSVPSRRIKFTRAPEVE